MKKKIKIIFLILSMVLIIYAISGCNFNYEDEETAPSLGIEPSITEYDKKVTGYSYAVDNDTGVVYLLYKYGYHCSMSVMLNSDGTPVTAEQLGITIYSVKGEK